MGTGKKPLFCNLKSIKMKNQKQIAKEAQEFNLQYLEYKIVPKQ